MLHCSHGIHFKASPFLAHAPTARRRDRILRRLHRRRSLSVRRLLLRRYSHGPSGASWCNHRQRLAANPRSGSIRALAWPPSARPVLGNRHGLALGPSWLYDHPSLRRASMGDKQGFRTLGSAGARLTTHSSGRAYLAPLNSSVRHHETIPYQLFTGLICRGNCIWTSPRRANVCRQYHQKSLWER